jgi:hypothetical protein
MKFLELLASLFLITATVVYLHAVFCLHRVIATERPEWVDRKGALSFFYSDMPRVADPNVGLAVLGVAFSVRARDLSAAAAPFVRRIRILLPALLLLYLGVLVVTTARAP